MGTHPYFVGPDEPSELDYQIVSVADFAILGRNEVGRDSEQ